MSNDSSSSASAIPTLMTLFAVALGAFIGVEAGRDPLILYLITTPFATILLWFARGVAGPDAKQLRPEAFTTRASVNATAMPAMAHAHKA